MMIECLDTQSNIICPFDSRFPAFLSVKSASHQFYEYKMRIDVSRYISVNVYTFASSSTDRQFSMSERTLMAMI